MPETLEAVPPSAPATQGPGQAEPAAVTPAQSDNGQAGSQEQGAPVEERFSDIDPETLSPELKGVYKNLQADYTKKSMNVAEAKKKAEFFDQVAARPDFKDWWSGASRKEKAEFKEQKAEAEKTLGQIISDAEFEESFKTKDGFLALLDRVANERVSKSQAKISELEEKLTIKDTADLVESYATQIDKEGKLVRPDFYKLDEDGLITGFLTVNRPKEAGEQAYRTKLDEAYAWAKNTTQKYYEMGKAETMKTMQAKAATSTEMPTNAAKGAYTGPDPKKLSVSEAIELAKKGIKVPRND